MIKKMLKRPSIYFLFYFIIAIIWLSCTVDLWSLTKPISYESYSHNAGRWVLFISNYLPPIISFLILILIDRKINDKNKILLVSIEVVINLLMAIFVYFWYIIQYSIENYWPVPS